MKKKMTIAEKIFARASGQNVVSANDYVIAKIDKAMLPEAIWKLRAVLIKEKIDMDKFKVWDPERVIVVIDHRVPPPTVTAAQIQKLSREFVHQLNIKHFYDLFSGIGHQIMVERGHALPGELIVGADSHTTTYGALNVASTGIGVSEMAYVLYTGELWFRVPETINFVIEGNLAEGVYSKDIILHLAGKYGADIAQYKAIEWTGPAIDRMSMAGRLTMGNMSVELGAKFGLFKADQKTYAYLENRTKEKFTPVEGDPGAEYAARYTVQGSEIEPQVALPHSVGNVRGVADVKGMKIDQAVIASCCHGRLEDLEIAAKMIQGKKVHPGVRFYVAPASWMEYQKALEKGIISALIDAGAMIGNPSCGLCTGYQGVLAEGERCIAAAPRNFKGRMGSPEAEIYLASPATVTASAISGTISDPREVL